MDQNDNSQPWQIPSQQTSTSPWMYPPAQQPQLPTEHPAFSTGKKELLLGLGTVFTALALVNCLLFGGANLGFALAIICNLSLSDLITVNAIT